tara:strand:+ start:430 stop:666 length:237 start_codon:yes stop_codon:yes gene_type:complete
VAAKKSLGPHCTAIKVTVNQTVLNFYRTWIEKIRYPKMIRHISSNGKVYMEIVINPDGDLNKKSLKVLRLAHLHLRKK